MLVGCGNMGGAMLAGWLRHGLSPSSVTVIDPSRPPVPDGVALHASIPAGLASPSAMVLAVKPQTLAEAARAVASLAGPGTLLLSVLAAVELTTLRNFFPVVTALVRAVPNLPASIGCGVTALAGDGLDAAARTLVQSLVAPLGAVEWLDTELLCDAVTSISGCGPAFLCRFADAVASAGERQGLTRDQALRLIAATMTGTGELLSQPGADPRDIARRVASPGGVTQAGLSVLDADDALDRLLGETLAAAASRNAEIVMASRLQSPPSPQGASKDQL